MAAVSVGTSAVRLDTVTETDVVSGSTLVFQPTNGTIYYGFSSGVTTTGGIPLASGQTFSITFDTAGQGVWAIAASTIDVRVDELGVS